MAEFMDQLSPPGALEPYWENMLKDFPDHPLHNHLERRGRSIPIILWGDEGNALGQSWMLATWKLGLTLIP